jgi:aryl-alcohol dehydrogenase-like predicted oxidoreductase
MEYRRLGQTGLKVTPLCLGTMQFGWTADEQTSLAVLTRAAELGLNFIDTADVYSRWVDGNPGGVAESIIGKWLALGVVRREQIVLATKVRGRTGEGPNEQGLSRAHILEAVRASARRLGTDYIDLYQTHSVDPATPIEETLRALDDLIREGTVRYVGCSNYPAWRLMQALWSADRLGLEGFVTLQPEYSLLAREDFERELEAVCLEYGLGVLPYSPLARGFLTGKYRREKPEDGRGRLSGTPRLDQYAQDDRSWQVLQALDGIARVGGASPSQVALGWLLQRPAVTSPIIGPRSLEQLEDNVGALGIRLTPEAIAELDRVSAWEAAA